jgi:hypothetical protein
VVRFSAAFRLHEFGADDWVRPGGELVGARVRAQHLYVFSAEQVFVFYGVSESPKGPDVFQYRVAAVGSEVDPRGPRPRV